MKRRVFSGGRRESLRFWALLGAFGLSAFFGGYALLKPRPPSAKEDETAKRQPQGLFTGLLRAGKRAAGTGTGKPADDLQLSRGWKHRDGINFRGERPDLPQEALIQFKRFWSAFPPAVKGTVKKREELIEKYQQTQDPEDFEELLRLTGVRSFISRQSWHVIQSLKPMYPNVDLFLQDALQESTVILFERLRSTKNAEYIRFLNLAGRGFLKFQNELERKIKAMLSYPVTMPTAKINENQIRFSPDSTDESELARAGGFSVFVGDDLLKSLSAEDTPLLYWSNRNRNIPQQSLDPFDAAYQDQIRKQTAEIARALWDEAPSVIRRQHPSGVSEEKRRAGDAAARYMISRRIFADKEERETLKSIAKKFNLSGPTVRKIERRLVIRARQMLSDRFDLRPTHPRRGWDDPYFPPYR